MKTYKLTCELEYQGEYQKDAEAVITTDQTVNNRTALSILKLLYPNFIVTAVTVELI